MPIEDSDEPDQSLLCSQWRSFLHLESEESSGWTDIGHKVQIVGFILGCLN